ncbi:hypothetical protein ABEV74_12540 [Paenibacillus cisolokensis]|uniref:DUF6115 domain-containing protein n=1 Tax=Paenibacillus cisolokensis TaxID=1658519 RepID=UPI003D2D2849
MQPWQYIVLLGAFALVCGLALPRKQTAQSGQSLRNMETALDQFMENMEADHRELVGLTGKLREETRVRAENGERRIAELEERCGRLERDLAALKAAAAEPVRPEPVRSVPVQPEPPAAAERGNAPAAEEAAEPESGSIRDRYAQLFRLREQGKSIEAIARKTNMPKGEVQLILQLAEREAAARD